MIVFVASLADAQPRVHGTVEGRVLLGDEGFSGIEVVVRGDAAAHRATTDANGGFRIEALAPGRYRIEATLAGFAPAVADVLVGESAVHVELRLAMTEVIELDDVTESRRLRESAEAVAVIDTTDAQRHSTDLGEVVARTPGVSVRRSGGLGSDARLSLAGLTDDQIRFFIDGVPLELAGFGLGIATVPLHRVDRVEVYRGVVPIRFGADALGGAVNLASDGASYGMHASASYQAGWFGTHRVALDAEHQDASSGVLLGFDAYLDSARNDYAVDVAVPDERGRLSPAEIDRFHDGYRAAGLGVTAGIVDQSWAERLVARGFVTGFDKEVQHNLVMTVPYGAVRFGERSAGGVVAFERALGATATLDVSGGYSLTRSTFLDVAECVYDWFGNCVRERAQPGEIDSRPHDQVSDQHGVFGRANLERRVGSHARMRVALAPTFVTRTGDERRQSDPDVRDPLTAERGLLTAVTGVEVELDALGDRLENVAFVKNYVQLARTEEPSPSGAFRRRDRETYRFGVGDGLRYRVGRRVYAKASYEWATRLPRPDEVFGDAALVVANLELAPETSHNANLGITFDATGTASGGWRLDANGFLRDADQLIVLLGNDRYFTYQNVFGARSLGVEAAAEWSSPGDHLAFDVNATYQDIRNVSGEGTFGDFDGDRIPNRPYLLANGGAHARRRAVVRADDELALDWHTRYVHAFFRGWESQGIRELKQVVPSQLVHSVALTYAVREAPYTATSSLEVQNLTDARVFDFFGVQRPGRAVFVKTTVAF